MMIFYASDKPREQELAAAFIAGIKVHGGEAEQRDLCASPSLKGATSCAMVGVKSKRLFDLCKAKGVVPIMLDKGYVRTRRPDARVWEYWRVSVGAHHPTRTTLMRRKMPADRLEQIGLLTRPWRSRGYSIVIAGSSAKYHNFYGLAEPNEYYSNLVEQLRQVTDKQIIYRPKPSFKDALPISTTLFSSGDENIMGALEGAWALVTHGSNACFEAAVLGIPSIILGDGIMAPISSTSLDEIMTPKLGKREQLFQNLAYHQWTEPEMRSGEAWATIKGWVDEQRP
jgi:hypothetical protein